MRQIVLLLAAFVTAVHAQDFPAKPVRIVVPWPPAGNVDITARTVAPAFGEALGQQVIVENRAGAGGRIGTEAVVKSPADGYTLLLGSSGTVTAGPAVWKNLSFDPLKELVAVGPIQSVPIVLTLAPNTPAKNYAEFAAMVKQKPGQVSMASAGNGSSNHLAIELWMRQANLQVLHVPYKGSGPALTDLIGSQVQSMMDQLTASIGHIKEGRIRAIAISSLKRSPLLPDARRARREGLRGGDLHRHFRPGGNSACGHAEAERRVAQGVVAASRARALPGDGRGSDGHEPAAVRFLRALRLGQVAQGRARREHQRRVSDVLPPDGRLRAPARPLPPGTVDCHAHIFDRPEKYPFSGSRKYSPPPCTRQAWLGLHQSLGVARGVQVNATP